MSMSVCYTAIDMNIGNRKLDLRIEDAIRLLCKNSITDQDKIKPVLAHAVRVGMFLYERDYSEDIVIAGLLHDALEWTRTSETDIKTTFGEKVLDIVRANTKDRTITDPDQRRTEYIGRCFDVGEEAVIVKAADVLDSYSYYHATKNENEIERCRSIAKIILDRLTPRFRDPIFKRLEEM